MGNLGGPEILLILVLALLLFGAKRLPELGRSFGSALREFKRGANEATDEVRRELERPPAPPAEHRAPRPPAE